MDQPVAEFATLKAYPGPWRLLFIVAAILLFLLAGIAALGWVSGVNQAACVAFGLAAYAVSRL